MRSPQRCRSPLANTKRLGSGILRIVGGEPKRDNKLRGSLRVEHASVPATANSLASLTWKANGARQRFAGASRPEEEMEGVAHESDRD